MKRTFMDLCWQEVSWQRQFMPETVQELLTHLAALIPRGPVLWEVRGNREKVRYFLGADRHHMGRIQAVFNAHGDVRFTGPERNSRRLVTTAGYLKVTRPALSLKTDLTEAVVRAGLSAMKQTRAEEQTVLQIVLGPSFSPVPMPRDYPDPHASMLQVVMGSVGPASAESRSSIKAKLEGHCFSTVVRLGATGDSGQGQILNLLSALRTLESAGVSLNMEPEKLMNLNAAYVPWHFKLRLSVKELSNFLLLPVGEAELPGVEGLHPKLTLPPAWYRNPDSAGSRTFAIGLGPAGNTHLSISPKDSLEHTHLMGPTGSGKSTAMQHLILADIRAGRSVLVIDPKADLVNDILARIPAKRDDDVVVLDPSDVAPVGFNPLAFKDHHDPGQIADAVLAVFQEVFKDNWGIRSQDILSATLLTLVQCPGASLLWLPALLTDEGFRKKVTANVSDKIGLEPFWAWFESLKETERREQIGPVLNKLRQFLLRPGLRNVLGQSNPKFTLTDLFNKPRIVLVPLNKGMIGAESARLLGSLIVGLTWTLALSRAKEPADNRHLVSVYIDELQDYLSLPTNLADALAQARGLGVGLTLAHQYREQLPPNIRAGVDANARNKIVFGLNAGDAKDMAAMAPELESVDFMSLPRYRVYTSFQQAGRNTGWVMGQTLPPAEIIRSPIELRAKSAARYGKTAQEVEREYLDMLRQCRNRPTEECNPDPGFHRRKMP